MYRERATAIESGEERESCEGEREGERERERARNIARQRGARERQRKTENCRANETERQADLNNHNKTESREMS